MTDIEEFYIVDEIFGTLEIDKYEKAFLLNSYVLEKVRLQNYLTDLVRFCGYEKYSMTEYHFFSMIRHHI